MAGRPNGAATGPCALASEPGEEGARSDAKPYSAAH
jgi:hypothetical protein